MLDIIEVTSKKDLNKFIDFPFKLYKDDPYWVPPLKHSLRKTIKGINNPLFMCGPHKTLLAVDNGQVKARLVVGINEKLNKKKQKKEGYISLFESIKDKKCAFRILDHAAQWLKENGMDTLTGPVSPTNGDDTRGLLIKGFDGSPVLMNSYNPVYYVDYFEDYGFSKLMDLYAYYFDPNELPLERYNRVVNYAMKKFNFHIDRFNPYKMKREVNDIKKILDIAMPESWGHLTPPSYEEIKAEVMTLKKYMDRDFVYIARSNDGDPIGFVTALPDYNQVLKKLDGKLLPFGFLKYLYYKSKIDGARIFSQFVIPKYRNKAVNGAIFYKLMIEGKKKGLKYGEGSTIAEMNTESIRSVEGAGGKLYRIYRLYEKKL